MYSVEDFDEAKTRVMKFIIYKRRTEQEVRTKFAGTIDEDMLEDKKIKLKEDINEENNILQKKDENVESSTHLLDKIRSLRSYKLCPNSFHRNKGRSSEKNL